MELIKKHPVLCIDPGTRNSGVVIFDGINVLYSNPKYSNTDLVADINGFNGDQVEMAIEGVACYGMPVGKDVFETVEWIGRFRQEWGFDSTHKIYRKDVKMFLCGSIRDVNDSVIRRRILDIFPATGGGKTPQIGIKKNKGPLYGVSSHAIQALAIGLTYHYYRYL